jgi:hypothetical protein
MGVGRDRVQPREPGKGIHRGFGFSLVFMCAKCVPFFTVLSV